MGSCGGWHSVPTACSWRQRPTKRLDSGSFRRENDRPGTVTRGPSLPMVFICSHEESLHMPSEVVRTNRTLAKLLVAVSLVLLFHGPSQAQTSPKLTDFVGQWSGKWDDKLPARWTIGLAPGGKEAIVYYECKDKDAPFRGSWLVGRIE